MSPRPKNNTERINVFFTKEVHAKLKKRSDERGMTVSGLVRMIVLDWLRKEDKDGNSGQ